MNYVIEMENLGIGWKPNLRAGSGDLEEMIGVLADHRASAPTLAFRLCKVVPVDGVLIGIQGDEADYSQLDSQGEYTATVEGGDHDGHQVTVFTEKHNCGAYGEIITCSCGEQYQSAMNGCWQQNHQRHEEGSESLRSII